MAGCSSLTARLWALKNGVAFFSKNSRGKIYLWTQEDISNFMDRQKTKLKSNSSQNKKAPRKKRKPFEFYDAAKVAEFCSVTKARANAWGSQNGVLLLSHRLLWTQADIKRFKLRKRKPGPVPEQVEKTTK
jgi:hypothetical protein